MPENLTEVISIRLAPNFGEQLEKLAEAERRPVAMMARLLMEEALSARARKATKKQ
jgi:predicted transcriptional regulator